MRIRNNKIKKERRLDGRRRRSGRDENLMEDRQLSLSSCSSYPSPSPPPPPVPPASLFLPPFPSSSFSSSPFSCSFYPSSSSLGTGSDSSLPSRCFLSSRSSASFFLFSSTRVCVCVYQCVCVYDCEDDGRGRSPTHQADGSQMAPLNAEKQQQIVAAVVTWSPRTYGDGTKRFQSAVHTRHTPPHPPPPCPERFSSGQSAGS